MQILLEAPINMIDNNLIKFTHKLNTLTKLPIFFREVLTSAPLVKEL